MKIYEIYDGQFNIEFIYSPLFEMLCSLHVLTKPEHHLERLKWAEGMKDKMDKKLHDEILYFGRNFYEWCSVMDFIIYTDDFNDLSIPAAIDGISQVNMDVFLYALLGEKASMEEVASGIRRKSGSGLNITSEQAKVFTDTEGIKRRLVSCLKEYYYLYFERELRYIEPVLVRVLKRHAEQYKSLGIMDYVRTLHNRIEVSSDAFYFHKYTLFTSHFKDLKNIVFIPSSFTHPHLMIGFYGKDTLHFNIRAHMAETMEIVPADLHNTMKALGDETRLKILRVICKSQSSTQSMATELGLTEACISKHLKILYEADLVYKERKGNYIYYHLNRLALDTIPMEIYQYLDGGYVESGSFKSIS